MPEFRLPQTTAMRDVANSKARAPRRVAPARLVAAEILRRVEEEGAYASVLLVASAESLRPNDRALTYELVLGTLRWQLWLDRCIEHFAGGRKVKTLDLPVRLALRLGLYQLRFLTRIPPSAAVNDSVNLAYEFRLRSAASFINAVLRRALREPDYDPALEAANKLEHAAISTSHPAWLIEKWARNFGWEEALAFARSNNEIPRNAFRINTQLISEEAALRRISEGGGAAPIRSELAPGAWLVEKGSSIGSLLQQMASEGLIYFSR
ncbi:MAG: transcription antitermination factor NusB [Pyrinomonadaceae bacterium]